MSHVDLVIRGGTVADGLGGEPLEADVAVAGGTIVEVGTSLAARGAEEIDAKGKLVTPGFVDMHTHYDGQVVWDNRLTPSSFHGVTTALMGNCGVGFAPVRAEDREKLIELMEGVEDIPGAVLRDGLNWAWESFADYLGFIAGRRYDMDIAAQLPHAPLRVFVMGERACRLEPATEADIAEMRRLCTEAIRAGAIGFSTSRSLNHRTVRGDPTPSLKASEAELMAIAHGIVDAGGGILELAHEFAAETRIEEFAMMRRIAATTGLPLSFGLSQKNRDPEGYRAILKLIEEAQADGVSIWAQVTPRPIGAIITVEGTANPFQISPTYKQIVAQGISPAMLAALRDTATRGKVLEETEARIGETLVHRLGGFDRLFVQHGRIEYEPAQGESILARAEAAGQPFLDTLYDMMHAGDGHSFIYLPVMNYARYNLDPVAEMLRHPYTLMGLGDGGAHVSIISDASFPTHLLTRWTNSRHANGFDLGWIIRRQTWDSARYLGMTDRGVVAAGRKADLNVIDLSRLALDAPTVAHDLPSNGHRLLQRAHGYEATIVSGEIVMRNGEATGALPGRLVKGKAALQ